MIITEAIYPVCNVLYFYTYMYVIHFSIAVNLYTTVVTIVCLFTKLIGHSCLTILTTMCHGGFRYNCFKNYNTKMKSIVIAALATVIK
jgi:hypothetical protein